MLSPSTDYWHAAGRVDVTPGSSIGSMRAFTPPNAGFDYFATEAHYRSLGERVIATLGGFSVVVVTGDPPASALALAAALSEMAGSRYTAIPLRYAAEPRGREPSHFRHVLSVSLLHGRAASETTAPTLPLVISENADGLSDEHIQEIFKAIGDRRVGAAVLLARSEFLARLERPLLHVWLARRLLVARLRFQELGADEIPAFIRHQLGSGGEEGVFTPEAMTAIANVSGGDPIVVNRFSRRLLVFAAEPSRDRLALAEPDPDALAPPEMPSGERPSTNLDQPPTPIRRGRGTILKLSAGTVFCLGCLGVAAVWLLNPAEHKIAAPGSQISAAFVTVPENGSLSGEAAPSGGDVARSAAPTSGSSPEEPAGSDAEPAAVAGASAAGPEQQTAAPVVAAPAAETVPAPAEVPSPPPRLSAAEIAQMVERGDRFFAQLDIASARLFYERAAEAGDAGAALKLAKTYDPVSLYSARLNGTRGDADRAAYWYRRARDLGAAEPR
jgi:hypothetical protein